MSELSEIHVAVESMETFEMTPVEIPALSQLVVQVNGRIFHIGGRDGLLEIHLREGRVNVQQPSSNSLLVESVSPVEETIRRNRRLGRDNV